MTKLTEEFLKAQRDRALLGLLCDKAEEIASSDLRQIQSDPTLLSDVSMTVLEIERRINADGLQDVFNPVVRILGDVPGAYLSESWVLDVALRINKDKDSVSQNPFSDWLDELEKVEPQGP